MKSTILLIIFFATAFLACKEDPKPQDNTTTEDTLTDSNADSLARNYGNGGTTEKTADPHILTGIFIRSDSESGTCDCNCVRIDFQQATELCLDKKSGLSIMASFKRMPDGSLDIYYEQPKNKGGIVNKGIPWEKFDNSSPIATISYSGNNAFDLDWIGFTIDDELAVDYAIYGKKNLEGNYRKM